MSLDITQQLPELIRLATVVESVHADHAERLAELMALAGDATPPVDACTTWRHLCAGVRQFADDPQRDIQLENDVLFPRFESDHR